MPKRNNHELGLTTARLEALVDSIFAIAMTLLVLNLTIPHIARESVGAALPKLLLSQVNDIFSYCLSFLLLAVFWMIHHRQFHFIKRTDSVHLWINILMLMFVTLVPFTTSLAAVYPQFIYTNVFFHSNMFVIGLLFFCDWSYATAGHHLVKKTLDIKQIDLGKRKNLLTPCVSLAAIILAFFWPGWSATIYISIPIFLILAPRD
jgi:uncharacterized membrane protein